jgi:hypothetical protein
MPANNCVWLHDVHTSPPAGPQARQQNPEQSIGLLEAEATRRAALEHGDLVAESGDLGLLVGAGLKCRGKQSEQGNEDRTHCENDDDLTNALTFVFSTRTEFSATTGSWSMPVKCPLINSGRMSQVSGGD